MIWGTGRWTLEIVQFALDDIFRFSYLVGEKIQAYFYDFEEDIKQNIQ